MNGKIQKVIDLYEASYDRLTGVCIYVNSQVYDTDFTSVTFYEDKFHFEFDEDELDDFEVNITEIVDIKFDKVSGMVVSILELFNGDVILIFNL
jgi:hypothetical protein